MISIKLANQMKALRPNVQEKTLNGYIKCLHRLNHELAIESSTFLDDPAEVKKYFQFKRYKDHTKKFHYEAIILFLGSFKVKKRELIEQYRFECGRLSHLQVKPMKLNQTWKENLVDASEVYKLLQRFEEQIRDLEVLTKNVLDTYEFKLLQRYVILSIFLQHPWIKNTMADIGMDDVGEERGNYMVKRDGCWVITVTKYKCVKYYGAKSLQLSEKTTPFVDCLLRHNRNSKVLLVEVLDRTTRLSRNGFTKVLMSLFNKHLRKNISSNLLKYIILTAKS
jgi:hypothetical protein